MIPKEWLKRIRRVEIKSKLISEQLMAGASASIFKGRGIDFQDVREYVPGDDVRRIDWNVSGRMRKTFVKQFIEERELMVMLLVDMSHSGHFGTAGRTKRELAAELAGAIAFSAVRDCDRVGLILFTDHVEHYIAPRKTRQHVFRLIRDLLYHEVQGQGTSIKTALKFLNHVVHRPAIVFLISDFLDEGYERLLKAANQRHDVIALKLLDPRELSLPDVGLALVRDAETGEVMEIDTGDPGLRAAYEQQAQERETALLDYFRRSKIASLAVRTDRPYYRPLRVFFERHSRSKVA
ncbi:MAG: DUF58 domain-containing protein [Verrucomicrobia bacterium]|nr:DUF58 domain-containing protein [Verrucomicrobiota bacterium]